MADLYVTAPTAQDRLLLEVLPCCVFLQRGGDIVYANRLAREMLGWQEKTVFPVEAVFQGAFPGLVYGRGGPCEASPETVFGSAKHPYTTEFECQLSALDGAPIPVRGSFRMLEVEPETQLAIVAMRYRRDSATGHHANFLEQLLNAAPEAIMITRGARILHINREFENLFGYSAEEAVGRNTYDLLIPETRRHEFDMLEHTMRLCGRASMETVRLSKSGELIDVSILVAPIELSGVEVGNFVSYRDIRDKKQTDAKLQHDALHDSLTGLANRALFLDRLQITMARQHRRQGHSFAVMFLDLDRFKTVNDSLGHACGDDLLVRVAARLRACVRPEDTVARFGGDEFAVLLEEVSHRSDAVRIAERVQQEIRLPIELYGHEILMSASLGIAFGTKDHATPEQILRDADFAMYQAKSHGHARYEIFDHSMTAHAAVKVQKEQDLRNALDNKDFDVCYQPIYRLSDGQLEGFEALLRWRRHGGDLESLDDLLPVAEETGLIVPIGAVMREQVMEQMRLWSASFPERPVKVSLNLSPRQLQDGRLLDGLAESLARSGVEPARLCLEITEQAVSHDPEHTVEVLQRMVGMGIGVALDNFGSGLASMNYFVRLPIELVKVDRRLTSSLTVPGRQTAVLQAIFDLGRLLKVRMLAEGIESVEQVQALRKLGCDLVQGHLFSPAVSRDAAQALLEKGRWLLPDDLV